MRVLALDTTTREGSAALVAADRVVGERRADPARSHAEQLPGELLLLTEACGVTIRDIDLFAVALGPGSFTGLRIGIATMQGLAFVTGRRLAGVSALEALAQSAAVDAAPGALVAAWMDAQRGEVYSALYRVADAPAFDAARLVELDPAAVASPEQTLARWAPIAELAGAAFTGGGAARYTELVRSRISGARLVGAPPLGAAIGRIALRRAAEAANPAAVRPLYVRRPDAELARDRAAGPAVAPAEPHP